MTEQSSEPREPVDSTQNSQSNDNNNSKVDIWIKRAVAITGIVATLSGAWVAVFAIVNEKNKESISKSPQIEPQIETAEQTEPWSAVFKTKDGNQNEPEEEEKLQLSFKDGNVAGSSISRVNGKDKEWTYLGYKDGNYLALSYRGKNTSTLGTVLMEQVSDGKYIGYWEGKLCSDSSIVIRCPYVLAKRDSADLHSKQISHLTKSCNGTGFNADSDETLTENPCL